jgi:AcrR family transcriptional regulator
MNHPRNSTGLGRRRQRLSDRETEQRMLPAAMGMISRAGLTVSLDHISFEDVIRDAGVSRSSAYRRWPYKDLFLSDLVKQLAKDATPTIVSDELELIRRVVAEHPDWTETAELRHSLVIELFRQLALFDFQTVHASAQWRTYLALHAAFMSLADSGLRDQVQAALGQSERDHIDRVAKAWERMTGLLGYRLRPELGVTFTDVAALADATLRGLVIKALSMPEIAERRLQAIPFGAASQDEWSLPAIGLASISSAFLEPDPAVAWGKERRATLREALSRLAASDI